MGLLSRVMAGAKTLPAISPRSPEFAWAVRESPAWAMPQGASEAFMGRMGGQLGDYTLVKNGERVFLVRKNLLGKEAAPIDVTDELADPDLLGPLLGAGVGGAAVYGGLSLMGDK